MNLLIDSELWDDAEVIVPGVGELIYLVDVQVRFAESYYALKATLSPP